MRFPSSSTTRFTIQPVNGGAILTMKKRIPASRFKAAVQRRLNEIRESYSKRPSYKLVTDIFGNRYYVDNREQLRAQMAQEMQSIDTKPIARQVSKSAFKDYELELEYSGVVLHVRSHNDAVDREFEFGGVIEDFSLAGCTMESDDIAVLRIKVTLQRSDESSDSQEKVKKVEIRDKREVEHEEKSTKTATTTTATTSKADDKVQKSQKVSPSSSPRVKSNEPKKIRRCNADKIKAKKLAEQAAAMEKARLKRLQQQQQQQQEEEKEKKRRQEEQERLAKEEERIKREQLLKEQAEYQRQLVEEERQLRAERQRRAVAMAAASSAVNSSDSEMSDAESISSVGDDALRTSAGPALSKTVSPVLEDVEDEEMERYNESVRRNSGSRSIIEDI